MGRRVGDEWVALRGGRFLLSRPYVETDTGDISAAKRDHVGQGAPIRYSGVPTQLTIKLDTMVSSLKDALLGAGVKAPEPKPKQARPNTGQRHDGKPRRKGPRPAKPPQDKPASKPLSDEEFSLAAAYKARTSQEQRERDLAKRKKEAEAKARRERLAKVLALIEGKVLNDADAEESRYFEYSRKIRRIYVTPEQQEALNAGQLGVVQNKGTYKLVPADVARDVAKVAPEFLALLVDPSDTAEPLDPSADSAPE